MIFEGKKDIIILRIHRYIDVAGEKTQVGVAIGNPNSEYETLMQFFDIQETLAVTAKAKSPQKSYDEAMEYFLEKYEIVTQLENDSYTVLHINDATDGVLFVYSNKNGGCIIDDFFKSYGDREIKVWFDEDGDNVVLHSVYPFGGPHGVTTMNYATALDEYDYQ